MIVNNAYRYHSARERFPRGLSQPEGGYRFSADALLLGSFLQPVNGMRVLDIGTGCGAAALAMLCRNQDIWITGADIQSQCVTSAKENAARLGFADRFTAILADAASPVFPEPAGDFDLVIANPPYRQRNRGRLPVNPSRLLSLFEEPETLPSFCAAAARALKHGGRFGIIFPAIRLQELLARLETAGLVPERLLYVCSYQGAKPRVVLVEAVKRTQKITSRQSIVKQTLSIHLMPDIPGAFSTEALSFCPFLAPTVKG